MGLSCDKIDTLRAQAHFANLGIVQLSSLRIGNAFIVRRTRKHIANTGPEYLKVVRQIVGTSVVSQGDRQATLAAGDFVLCDTTRPYQIFGSGQCQMQAMRIPLGQADGCFDLVGHRRDSHFGSSFLEALLMLLLVPRVGC
jgi:hypothetical protein